MLETRKYHIHSKSYSYIMLMFMSSVSAWKREFRAVLTITCLHAAKNNYSYIDIDWKNHSWEKQETTVA